MCGIFGYTGSACTPELLVNGIRRLEYRGYDSWGIAAHGAGGKAEVLYLHKEEGRIPPKLALDFPDTDLLAGITHTRWATHGAPSIENAHPQTNEDNTIAIVHNGIIENFMPLKEKLLNLGHTFRGETDSEIVAHLVDHLVGEGLDVRSAFLEALKSIEGTYGIALITTLLPGSILVGRMGSPLVIGQGEGYHIIASDPSAIVQHTRYVVYLEDGECAQLNADSFETFGLDESIREKEVEKITFDLKDVELGGFHHFMEKEIHEQPQTVNDAMRGRILRREGTVKLGGIEPSFLLKAKRIKIIACGTSWHAGLIGKYLFENLAGIPTDVHYAAEFRYANPVIEPDTLVIAVSQSGETADTLAGVREAKNRGAVVMGVVNVVGSTIARECGQGVFLHAGPEIGVASTKAFTSQVVVLSLLALEASRQRTMSLRDGLLFIDALEKLPGQIEETLELDDTIRGIAEEYAKYSNFLYIGRLYEYPLALEGALKLKEISYVHAEGVPAAELKHGPIALVDKKMPVVVCAAQSKILDKMVSNVNEIHARGGRIISVVSEGTDKLETISEHVVTIPKTVDSLVPILGVIPLQLLAYHIAVKRGCDVDRPRNLAKSVTVE